MSLEPLADPYAMNPSTHAPRWAVGLAKFFLRLSTVSRLCPVRGWMGDRVRRLNGCRFSVQAHHGVRIDAVYISADQQPRPGGGGSGDRPLVVMAHGWLEAKEYLLIREAALVLRHGHDVVLVDLRAHGRSGGTCVSFGVFEKYDIAAVVTEAQRRGWASDQVLTYGHSLGAATMLQHAAIDPRVAAVVAMCPYTDMVAAVRSFHQAWAPWVAWPGLIAGFEAASKANGFSMDQASPHEAVGNLPVPVLFVVGDSDRLLPDELHTRRLVTAKTRGQRRYVQVPGAGHVSVSYKPWPGLDDEIGSFLACPHSASGCVSG